MRILLFLLVSFVALTALFSGIAMMYQPDGSTLRLSTAVLESTPFGNFFLPGILLTVAIGGINLAASWMLVTNHPYRYSWTLAGGVLLTLWLLAELLLLNGFYLFHLVYFIIASLIIFGSYQLKGRWLV